MSRGAIVGLLLYVAGAHAATVRWQSTTKTDLWVDKGTIETTNWDNDVSKYITIDEMSPSHRWEGHGGCFNELGWKVLMKLSQSTRDSIMKLLFDTTSGSCNFSVCRVPIGANDYTISPYTLNENSGDYTMEKFSIEHDRQYLIPYMKAAVAVRPSLKIWGSPWTVPTWMKDSKTYNNGSMLDDTKTFSAYALYLAKAVKSFQKEGLNYYAVMPANEMNWKVSMGYPVTGWSAAQMGSFIKNHLGPTFRKEDVNADIFLGTLMNDQDVLGAKDAAETIFKDSTTYSYCAGAGFQYGMPEMRVSFPDKRYYQTETACGTVSAFNNANNFWNYAVGNDDAMRQFVKNARCNAYEQWNIVLDTSGSNIAAWRQYAMIMVDTVTKKVTFTPQFYQVRHYGYAKPGGYVLPSAGNSNMELIAFRNPDGENVLMVTNKGGETAVAINLNGQKIKPTIPANSFNTFRIAGTPIPPVSAFAKVEAEKFDEQSGTLIRACSDGGSGLTLIEKNDWAVYYDVDFGTGAGLFEARVSGIAGGTIEVHLDSCTSPVAGTATVAASAAWSTVSCPVTGVSGRHTLYLKFKGDATGKLFDLNWFNFVKGTSVQGARAASRAAHGSRIVVGNGLSQSTLLSASQKTGAFSTVYDLSGKVVASSKDNVSKARSRQYRGIYIVQQSK